MGLGLGDGYGRYMGFYGLVTDNLLSMNVVLANGSAITVSGTSTPDLWWGMRGAGHNFGIVTNLNTKIYKRTVDEWFYITYIFRQDKLEPLFEAVNNMMKNGTQPKELMNNALYAWPVIVITIYYVGTAEQAAQYLGPYDAIGPVSSVNDSIPYPKIADAIGSESSSAVCQSGLSRVMSPVGLLTYNITANRQAYDLFTRTTSETPALNSSILLFEGYSLRGMKTVDPDSTAFPHRSDNILVALETSFAPDSSLDATAIS
ncbi:hypothetical protein MMC29_002369 [Sticta canariensis]|nr:hypothetical protein [Sticta canariensis]